MDLKEIKQIVDLMKRSGLTEFEIEEEGLKLRICRSNGETQNIIASPTMAPFPMSQASAPTATPVAEPEAAKAVDPAKLVKSPMVGTFYAAPSPDSPSFAKVGDTVTADTTVCIIEAMKVMNEIKAEVNGTIAEILVENGASVEYNQPLFRLK